MGTEQQTIRIMFERGSQRESTGRERQMRRRGSENNREASGLVYMKFILIFTFLPGYGIALLVEANGLLTLAILEDRAGMD